MGAKTPIAHDPELPFVVLLTSNGRIVARLPYEEAAVQFAEGVAGYAVDTSPREFPTLPGLYEGSRYPLSDDAFRPFRLYNDGRWTVGDGQEVSEADLIGAGKLTRLVAAK